MDEKRKIVYAVGKRTSSNSTVARHADDGTGRPICQHKAHSGKSFGGGFVQDVDTVTCKRCLKLLDTARAADTGRAALEPASVRVGESETVANLRQALHEAATGQTEPVATLWDGVYDARSDVPRAEYDDLVARLAHRNTPEPEKTEATESADADVVKVEMVEEAAPLSVGDYVRDTYGMYTSNEKIGVVDKVDNSAVPYRVKFTTSNPNYPYILYWYTPRSVEAVDLSALSSDKPAATWADVSLDQMRCERDDLAARLAQTQAALKEARDSLLAIRDLAKPYEDNDNFMFSRIVSHAEYGLSQSEDVAKAMGMETLKKPAS